MSTAKTQPMIPLNESSIADRLLPTLQAQRAAFLSDGPPPLARRQVDLQALEKATLGYAEKFVAAVNEDFGHLLG
jgi:coniferyl-aldehyde dehydrogenase